MYYTHTKDSKYVNQNIGVRTMALDGLGRKAEFFGIIEDIWKLDYRRDIKVALFQCHWIKQHQFNEIELRVVDLQNVGYHDPWVLASCVAQVCYMPDPHSMLPQRRELSTWLSLGNNTLLELMASKMLKPTITMMRCRYSQTLLRRSVLWKKNLPKDILPWERKGVKGKVVMAGA
jgi:hypothetical protein